MKRALALLAISGAVIGMAIWLTPASIHIVRWDDAGPARVALLQPLAKLWTDLLAIEFVLALAGWLAWRRGGEAEVAGLAAQVFPFNLLWLWALPYAPWLPDRAPLLLLLAGPGRWVVLAFAVVGALWMWARCRWGALPRWWPGRRTIFAASLVVYLCAAIPWTRLAGPGADEPHYLVITQSLLLDHDLRIENNHQRRDYRAYFGGELKPDYLERGRGEVIYSIHAPGLPALLVPAFAAGGYPATVMFMCLVAALAALAIFDIGTLVGGPAVALITWLATCLTVPFVPHAWLIFPEMPAALLTAWAVLWLLAPMPERVSTWFWRGLALALLPWLHTKYAVLLAALAAALLWRLRTKWREAMALVLPLGVSGLLWLWSFYVMYGVLNPEAPYGAYPRLYVKWTNIPRGLLGLALDQKFGLLVYAPVFLFAVPGVWRLLTTARLRLAGGAALVTVIGFALSTTRLYMWWGGSSAPARFLVPVVPLLAVMIAAALTGLRSIAGRALFMVSLIVSVAISAVGMLYPAHRLFFSDPHGVSRLITMVQDSLPLAAAMPMFTEGPVRAPFAQVLPWLAALVIACLATALVARRPSQLRLFWSAATLVTTFCVALALTLPEFSAADRRAAATAGHGDLLVALDGTRLRAFDYRARRKVDGGDVIALSAIDIDNGSFGEDARRLAGPLTLPPGRYDVRVWFKDGEPGRGTVSVSFAGTAPLAGAQGDPPSPAVLALTVPVTLSNLWVSASDATLGRRIERVRIEPRQIVPRSERLDVSVDAVETIAGRPGAMIVYTDDRTYPEGGVFWTRGTSEGTIAVAPAGSTQLILTLHVGPNAGPVHLSAAGQDYSVVLGPEDTRDVTIPVPPGILAVPIQVRATRQFRPVDVDPRASDTRRLGCQVRVAVR